MKPALYAALVLAVFLLASLGSFWLAVRPPRLSIPLRPEDYRLTVEAVRIRADDGVRLAGWFVPRAGAPAIVLLHGYPAEKADLLPLATALAPEFAALLVDHRYFGDSEGGATTLGFRERRDLTRVLDFLEARGAPVVGVFGLSLGGAVALLTAAEDPRIRAVAAYAPFADLKTLGHELYAWMWLARYPFVEAMLLWSRLVFGADISHPTPAGAAARLRVPVLLVHSRADEQIPFRHAQRLRAALAGNAQAEFEFLDRGRHGELPAGFEGRLARFFRRALTREAVS
ncbi:MAG TPA: alpha/beta fold hydrolase [Methylomirabilota bacterium]|nr:alpha/beta fold hydrolase [Methylomirabilota bacterium]